ncbi:MAG: sigma-70 family RNA polymerase sigma factor [Planctomycetia bacterium]|nr:sigma-70 family RNA polymerase sigma factor [Planctomycetia bacterium]
MNEAPTLMRSLRRGAPEAPTFIFHPSFESLAADEQYGETPDLDRAADYMADDVTRDHAQRMHYAAWRASEADDPEEAGYWRARYLELRDRIVVGNRKLVFRAVRRWSNQAQRADDLIGECYLVLIRAVGVYNPWLGVRFSTYAYTCLMRALSRLSTRNLADRLTNSLPLENLADNASNEDLAGDDGPSDRIRCLDEYLRGDHPLLSTREKTILLRRFSLSRTNENQTLEAVGHDLGLSKERVRQVQAIALDKLRKALGRM